MVKIGSIGGGAIPKIINGALLGTGLTLGYIFVNWAVSAAGQMAASARYGGFQGNVIPHDINGQYNYDSPAYGPIDETRFSG